MRVSQHFTCVALIVLSQRTFTKNDLDTFMEFLKEQHSRLNSENNQHQYPLFKEGFEMPTAKDENDG